MLETAQLAPRVLVADDEPVTLRLHQLYLSRKGYQPVLFENGTRALDDARATKPAIAILDYQLPGMNGLELVKAFRGDPELKNIPIIVVTGFRELDLQDELKRAGANSVVLKPFSSKLLQEEIDQLVGNSR